MDKQKFVEQYGPWAIVTGASAGIGEEFATQLASYGLNLVLVARRKEKLSELADILQQQYGVEIRVACVDLSKFDFMDDILQATQDIDVGLLVNNAGIYFLGNFLDFPIEKQIAMLDLNIRAPMLLTHTFAKEMSQRNRGGIIVVSSASAGTGVPLNASYAASKTFNLVFGEGLHYELKKAGVDVQVLLPGGTNTEGTRKMLKDAPSYMLKMVTPSAPVVTASLKNLGRKTIVIPGLMNNIMSIMSVRLMPRSMAVKMWQFMMESMIGKPSKTAASAKSS